jgi:hypothetical protein
MDSILMSLWSFTSLVTPVLLFLASVYYLSKGAKADSILLFIGSGIGLLVHIFYIWIPHFVESRAMPMTEASKFYATAGIVGFVGGLCFAGGFFVLINNTVNTYKQDKMY